MAYPGREWSDWSQELRIPGEELRWKFTSDGSVNGWGWLLTVYPIMPAAAPLDMLSDRTILSRPSIDLVTCLLDFKLENTMPRSDPDGIARSWRSPKYGMSRSGGRLSSQELGRVPSGGAQR